MSAEGAFSEAYFPESREEFSELIRYTLPGYLSGLLAGIFLDSQGFQQSPLGQWFVRTLAEEGESIFEGIFSIRSQAYFSCGAKKGPGRQASGSISATLLCWQVSL